MPEPGGHGKQRASVLKTLSDNERKIMGLLIESGGMRRNILERQAGIAKSSLASTLAQLERKKLVAVNRENTVHFVETSEWFNGL